ncbi:RidA family protein [Xylophilus sp. Kf1]|nr:RidA family protein [Xylophilus sp. Kf1]
MSRTDSPKSSSAGLSAAPRDVVFPPGRRALYERNRYSPAVRSNGFLFVSGQVGSRDDGSPEPDFETEVRGAFDHLDAILAAAGGSFADVVDVTVFIVDPQTRFDTVMRVLPDYWGEAPYPTLTGVGVTWLYGFSFEIKVIARLPAQAPGPARVSAPAAAG